MSGYKLYYFDVRGVAEPIRFIFAINNVTFEDKRIEWTEWEAPGNLKKELGFGQLPVLEFNNGKTLTQSLTIMRYLGKIFKMIPEDDLLAARCDELADILTEIRLAARPFVLEQDADKKSEMKPDLVNNVFPKYYNIFNQLVSETEGGPFIAGNKLSWADLLLANWLEIWEELVVSKEFLNSYPALQIFREAVFKLPALSDYLAKRPKTWI